MARGPDPQHKRCRPFGETIGDAYPFILGMVHKGRSVTHACELAGFSRSSVNEWIVATPERRAELDKARADRDDAMVQSLFDKAIDDPRIAQWWLERRRPQEWGRAEKVEITGKDGGPIATTQQSRSEALQELTDMARTSPEVRAALIQIVRDTDPDASR